MKLTKLVHSCILVETEDGTALFDPGVMSEAAVRAMQINKLDDIFITHSHGDHLSVDVLKELVVKFPSVRITTTPEVVSQLAEAGITASDQAPPTAVFFEAPHEDVEPMYPMPQEIGVHYLDVFTHPGDSHSFKESKDVLALPVTAPWGSTVKAVQLGLEHQPKYIIPIHDWHWNDDAREQTYGHLQAIFKEQGITFLKPSTGKTIEIEVK